MNTDKELQRAVEQELFWEPSVHAEHIGVSVKKGIVQLDGHVNGYHEKWAAERATLRVADAATGKVRDVIDEKVETYFEGGDDKPNWRFLPASDEVIWFSERHNWGQLYLYDAQTGRLKHQLTTG